MSYDLEFHNFSFSRTGCDSVDKLLHTIAEAARWHSSTKDWTKVAHVGGDTYLDKIQKAAYEAASDIATLKCQLEARYSSMCINQLQETLDAKRDEAKLLAEDKAALIAVIRCLVDRLNAK
jgi:hypothetical protein